MNCPYCKKYFDKKSKAVDHIEKAHPDQLNGMTPEQALYFGSHGTLYGICMCGCGKPTEWNYKTGKPFKLSTDPECRKRVFQKADANYKRVHGESRGTTLRTNMEIQKQMQEHRPTAGKYTFKDGGSASYLSRLELNFLQFNDKILELPSRMVLDCPFTFQYFDPQDRVYRTYMPDYYLPDYNLLVEIKEGGKHPNTNPAYLKETKYKEKLKDEVMRNQTEYNFIKIVDANYGPYMEILFQIVEAKKDPEKRRKQSVIVISETACELDNVPTAYEPNFPGMHVLICKDPTIGMTHRIAIAESPSIAKVYLADGEMIRETTLQDPMFDTDNIVIYKYIGDKNLETNALRTVIRESNHAFDSYSATVRILDILSETGIQYQFDRTLSNNRHRQTYFVKVGTLKARKEEEF